LGGGGRGLGGIVKKKPKISEFFSFCF